VSVFVGFDWGETRHTVEVLDAEGVTLARFTITDTPEGVGDLHAVVADHADDPAEVIVGSETDRGLVVGAMMAAGYRVYAVNPKAADRYRDRHSVSGAKSDRGDAKVLADMVRTDRHNLRLAGGGSELAEAIKVLTRTHQSLIWARQRHVNQLRAGLRDFYPQALEAFGTDLSHRDAVAVLAAAPSPAQGKRLTRKRIETLLTKGGRQRNIMWRAGQIHRALHTPSLQAPDVVAGARAASTQALVGLIAELNHQIANLETELRSAFEQHPDTGIILSLPGIGTVLGARLLAEFGDDPNRYLPPRSAPGDNG
jgi:transposase